MSFLLLAGASWVLGTWAQRALRIEANRESWVIRLWLGLCLSGLVALVLGIGSLQAVRFVLYVVAVFGLGYEVIIRSDGHRPASGETFRPRILDALLAAVPVLGIALALLPALAPAADWEAGAAHLAVAAQLSRAGQIIPLKTDPLTSAVTPLHALYAYAHFDGGEFSARLLAWSFGVLSVGSMLVLGWRTGGLRTGLVAGAILAATPVFYTESGSVSLDLATAGLVAASLAQWVAWEQEGRRNRLAVAALLAGTAAAVRPIALLVPLLLALGVLITPRSGRRRSIAVLFAVAVAAVLPWWLYGVASRAAFAWPGFPYLTEPAEFLPALAARRPDDTGFRALLAFPWKLAMRPFDLDGWAHSPGGLAVFLGAPGLLVGGPWARRLLAFSILGGLVLFFVEQSVQAFLPFLLPAMAAAAHTALHIPAGRRSVAALVALHLVYGLAVNAVRTREEWPVVLGRETRADYLTRHFPQYPAYAWLNERVENGERVLSLDPWILGLRVPAHRDYESAAALAGTPLPERLRWLRANRVRYVLYPRDAANSLPGFRESPLRRVLEEWRSDRRLFRRVWSMSLPGPEPGARYEVEVLESRHR